MECEHTDSLNVVRAPTLSRRNAKAAGLILLVCFAGLLSPVYSSSEPSLLTKSLLVLFDLTVTAGLSIALYRIQRDARLLAEYRGALDALQRISVLLLDQDGVILDCNRGAERLIGLKRTQLIGRNYGLAHPPEQVAENRHLEALRTAVVNGTYEDHGWRVREDGTRFWATETIAPLYDSEQRLTGFSNITHDSTLRKIAEDQANDRAALLDAVVNGTFDIIFLKNKDLQYELINAAGCIFLGRPDTEIVGKTDEDIFSPDIATQRHHSDREIIESGSPKMYEEDLELNGLRRTFLIHKSPWRDHRGKIVGVVGIATDITARRRVKNAEQRASAYRVLFDDAPIPYHEIDTEGIVRRVNQAECDLMRRTAAEMVGRPLTEFMDAQDRERIANVGSDEVGPFDRTYIRGDGTRVTVEVHERSIRDHSGRGIGMRAALVDRSSRLANGATHSVKRSR